MDKKMKTAVSQLSLGKTRVSGYVLYDHETMAFEETVPLETKKLIRAGRVNGLKLVNGEVALDVEKYNMKDLTIRSGVGRYRLFSNPELYAKENLFYLTKMFDANGEIAYEIVSNLCARLVINENALRDMYFKGRLSGLWIDTITETIKLSDGVDIIDIGESGIKNIPEGTKFGKHEWDLIENKIKSDIAELAAAGDEDMMKIDQHMKEGMEYDIILIPSEYMKDILREEDAGADSSHDQQESTGPETQSLNGSNENTEASRLKLENQVPQDQELTEAAIAELFGYTDPVDTGSDSEGDQGQQDQDGFLSPADTNDFFGYTNFVDHKDAGSGDEATAQREEDPDNISDTKSAKTSKSKEKSKRKSSKSNSTKKKQK